MHIAAILGALLGAGAAVARSPHIGKTLSFDSSLPIARTSTTMAKSKGAPANMSAAAANFYVDGTKIPDVHFDIGESYAGLLPISKDKNETRKMYFWYFPSENSAAEDEITIWLTGGPGCSSLIALLQENGPFLWQSGTFAPVKNPYSWTNLTNMVWVDQPVGTGFSQGVPSTRNEEDVAEQFLGFFKNFLDTFGLHNKKVYIAGESYAGYYVPYIADAMLNKNDTKHYGVESIMIYDALTSTNAVQQQIPVAAFVDYWSPLFSLNATFTDDLHSRAKSCGYTDFLNDYLVFPPKGPLPTPSIPVGVDNETCALWKYVMDAAFLINPCFDVYHISASCPLLWDQFGFPTSFPYLPVGAETYFNRSDVQKAINAPQIQWQRCANNIFLNDDDTSSPSGLSVLPHMIERLNKTIIGHGGLDFTIQSNGTLLMIQNMTFHGKQGFQSAPHDDFYVPQHTTQSLSALAGAGVFGITHTERGLTYVYTALSGHMTPQFAPSAAYRQLEFLLGRIGSLTEVSPFTTDREGANRPGSRPS